MIMFDFRAGLTVADLVFPWFIFIMGTSIDLSQRSLLSKGIRKQTVFKKIFVRSLKLFAIGLFLNNGELEKLCIVLCTVQLRDTAVLWGDIFTTVGVILLQH